ncbi:hypothetical protein ACEPAF_5053 [Sanghuangporus sanghuang]
MVSGSLIDALVSPSQTLKDLFARAVADRKIHDFPIIVRDHFASLFSGDALDQVPILDVLHPPNSYAPMSLVRFTAMVQDTSCSPEVYLSCLKDVICGGWGLDSLVELPENLNLRSDSDTLKERDVIWAVTIPGQGHWCEQSRAGNAVGTIASSSASSVASTSTQNYKSHKYPIPDSAHIAVLLKVYDNSAESLKPASSHEFVGVLTSECPHSEFGTDESVPTLHVVFHRALPKTMVPVRTNVTEGQIASIVRDDLISWAASEALGGDRDAAEWILLSCLSSVESRNPPLFPMSITLSGFPRPSDENIPSISFALSEMLPLHFLLPLTLELLNERSFLPESKDEDLHAGILQVPIDTTITITESGMTEGCLEEKGLENIRAIHEVVKAQTLQYKFPFSQYSFPTDIKFITITDGKKSLFLDSGVIVPLQFEGASDLYKGKDTMKWPSPQRLSAFRELIVRAKTTKATMEEGLSEHIQNEFVRERQEKAPITPDDLARRMTLARLITMSRLESFITLDSWKAAKALDERRLSRVS